MLSDRCRRRIEFFFSLPCCSSHARYPIMGSMDSPLVRVSCHSYVWHAFCALQWYTTIMYLGYYACFGSDRKLFLIILGLAWFSVYLLISCFFFCHMPYSGVDGFPWDTFVFCISINILFVFLPCFCDHGSSGSVVMECWSEPPSTRAERSRLRQF